MFLFRRNLSLKEPELNKIKDFFSKTIEDMLTTREETLNILKQYDIVLLCSWQGNYLIVDIYQLSKFTNSNRKDIQLLNSPFYTAARSLDNRKETIIYLDEHKEKELRIKNLQAFYYICSLLDTLDVDVLSAQEYRCVWS